MSQLFLDDLKKDVGFVPNLAAKMAESSTLIETFVTVRKILGRSVFTGIERETISLAVSVANNCTYCIAAHSTFAKKYGISEQALASLRAGETPADARLGALATYTRHLLANRGHATDEAKNAMLSAGFTDAQVLEVIAIVAFTTIANYAHNVSGVAIDAVFQ